MERHDSWTVNYGQWTVDSGYKHRSVKVEIS